VGCSETHPSRDAEIELSEGDIADGSTSNKRRPQAARFTQMTIPHKAKNAPTGLQVPGALIVTWPVGGVCCEPVPLSGLLRWLMLGVVISIVVSYRL
jgi:hypothetical protein